MINKKLILVILVSSVCFSEKLTSAFNVTAENWALQPRPTQIDQRLLAQLNQTLASQQAQLQTHGIPPGATAGINNSIAQIQLQLANLKNLSTPLEAAISEQLLQISQWIASDQAALSQSSISVPGYDQATAAEINNNLSQLNNRKAQLQNLSNALNSDHPDLSKIFEQYYSLIVSLYQQSQATTETR